MKTLTICKYFIIMILKSCARLHGLCIEIAMDLTFLYFYQRVQTRAQPAFTSSKLAIETLE